MSRGERRLLGFFGAAWVVAVLHYFGVVPLAGALALSLYLYYGVAACLGWLSGNVFVLRRRRAAAEVGPLLVLYLFGPLAAVYLLWALASPARQQAAPLAALWAFGVYGVFYLVPVLFPPPVRPVGGGGGRGRRG